MSRAPQPSAAQPGAAQPSAAQPLGPLVGRRRELAGLQQLRAASRLITLRGPGGAGKTRLALEFAARTGSAYPGGVWLVELGSLTDPILLTQTVAATVGVAERPGEPLLTTVAAALTGRRVLLVLDGCEHLVDTCAHLAHQLLSACPNLTVLATSREALDVPGEAIVHIGPLSLPRTPETANRAQLLRSDAVRLFVERAGAAQPGFELTAGNGATVAGICARLDGNALAIELAARRVAVLGLGGIADRQLRQSDLRATIDWSYVLLDDVEKVLFRRLSVFVGGFGLDAARAVCGRDDLSAAAILDLITGLEAKSLLVVRADPGRFHQLESIRLFADERLVAAGEDAATRQRMVDWLTALAERFARQPFPTAGMLQALDAERHNLIAALSLLAEQADQRRLLLAAALVRCWRERGYFRQGRTLLRGVLDDTDPSAEYRSTALVQAAGLATAGGDLQQARELADEAVALDRAAGRPATLARALTALLTVDLASGEHRSAMDHARAALELVRTDGTSWDVAVCGHNLAYVALHVGELDEAAALLAESLPGYRVHGEPWLRIGALHTAGMLALERDDLQAARAYFREGVAVPTNHPARKMGVVEGLAIVAVRQGRARRALRLGAATTALRRGYGVRPDAAWSARVDAAMARAGERLVESERRRAVAAGGTLTVDQTLAYAREDPAVDDEAAQVLTARELEVAELVADGLSNRELALRLGIAERTAAAHLDRIRAKLDLQSRTQVASWAARRRLGPAAPTSER